MQQLQPTGFVSPLLAELGKQHLRRALTRQEAAEIQYSFSKLSNGGSTVTERQLKIALRALGFAVKTEDVRQLLQQTGHTAPLDQGAFTEVMAARLQQRAPDEELRRAFGLFDLHGSGRISLADLTAIAQQLQCDINPSELKDMIEEFDQNGDGMIDEAEFRAIMGAALADTQQ